jgi:hypothetical protein
MICRDIRPLSNVIKRETLYRVTFYRGFTVYSIYEDFKLSRAVIGRYILVSIDKLWLPPSDETTCLPLYSLWLIQKITLKLLSECLKISNPKFSWLYICYIWHFTNQLLMTEMRNASDCLYAFSSTQSEFHRSKVNNGDPKTMNRQGTRRSAYPIVPIVQ